MTAITGGNQRPIINRLNAAFIQTLVNYLEKYPDEMLHIPAMLMAITQSRISELGEDDIKCMAGGNPAWVKDAIEHNLDGLKSNVALFRPMALAMPLRSIEYIATRLKQMKVLSVGPRTESEIFALVATGFDPANIKCLDLISYSELVDLGDMHDMPYEDDSFDVIVLGWVLAYSTDQPKAVSEVLRVARAGAIVAVGCEYNPLSNEELRRRGVKAWDTPRFDRTDEILELFGDHVETIYFRHDIHPTMRDKAGGLMVIFQLRSDGEGTGA